MAYGVDWDAWVAGSIADAATITTSKPTLTAGFRNLIVGSGNYARFKFQLATNSGFTTGVQTYAHTAVPGGEFIPFNTQVTRSATVTATLSQGITYWWRCWGESPDGSQVGTGSPARTFTVSHPPVASVISPSGDVTVPYTGTTTSPLRLTWAFSDPWNQDAQTHYEWDLDTNAGADLQTNAVTSAASFEDITVLAAQKDVQLRWRVRVKDFHAVQSAYSSFSTFYISDPPTVAITYPVDTGFVLEPNPVFLWTFGGTRSRTQYKYLVEVLDASLNVLHTSGEVFSASTSYTLPLPFSLDVGVPYKVRLTVTDSLGLTTVKLHSFQTTYDAPAHPTFTLMTTNYSQLGYVRIAWSNDVEDAAFRAYRVYRSDDFGLTYREIHETRAHAVTTSAITFIKEVGQNANNTPGTTTTVSVATGGVPIGHHCIAYISVDNAGTNGVAPGLTVTDARSNVWTVQPAVVNDPGAVNDGIVAYLAWTKVTVALLAADVITFTWGVSVTAKAVSIQQFSGIRGANPIITSATATGVTTATSITATPTFTGQLVVGVMAVESGTADTFTQDADTLEGSWVGITRRGAGTTTAGATINGAYKIITGTSPQIYDPTLGTARDWAGIIAVFDPAGTYTFDDYTAPSHDDVYYYVVQVAERFSQEFEGTKAALNVDLLTEDYWIVSPDQSVVVRLWQTTADDFGDDYEEEEIIIIGRGRKYDVGTRIGTAGELGCQLRTNSTKTARQQRFDLESIREARQGAYVRNPFGDVWLCYIGKIQFGRVAGVGANEYLDCSIPYSEVS